MDQPAWKNPRTALIVDGSDAARQRRIPNLASVDLNLLVELEALLQYRNITVLTAAVVVAMTDLVLMIPNRVATRVATMLPLAIVDPPVELKPYEVALIWHQRCHHDLEHRVLRREIAAAARMGRLDVSQDQMARRQNDS